MRRGRAGGERTRRIEFAWCVRSFACIDWFAPLLADVARATNLRVEDAAFAMNECGMLDRRQRLEDTEKKGEDDLDDHDQDEECVFISREMVEAIAKERNVKRMCMDLAHVLL